MNKKIKMLLRESEKLKKLSINQIIDFISNVSRNFPKSEYAERIVEEISKNTDYSREMIKTGIKNAFLPFQNKNNIKKLLKFEIHNEKILDKWVKIDKNIYLKAFSFDYINAIFSGNIPGIEIQIIFPALLSKTCVYAKPSYKMHLFLKEFKEYMTKNFEKFSNFIEVEIFSREENKKLKYFLKDAEIIVVQGSADTIKGIKNIAGDKRVIEYPTMFGAGVLKKKDFSEKILKDIALDIFLYNHRGCMSPFIIFLEEKIDFEEFCEILNLNFGKLKKRYRAKEIDFDERVRKRQIVDTLLFEKDLYVKDYDFKFVKTERIIDLFFSGIVQVVYYKKSGEILNHLRPFLNFLQVFALSSNDEKLINLIAKQTSCIRITRWGKMQFPPLFFANKGSFGIKQFLKFCVLEK